MIMIERIKERYCPVVLCDYCDGKIERASEGNYYFVSRIPYAGPEPMLTLHKTCSRAFEDENPLTDNLMWGSEELRHLPFFLEGNLDIDHEAVERSWKEFGD